MNKLSDAINDRRQKEKAFLRGGKVAVAQNNLRATVLMSAVSATVIGMYWIYCLISMNGWCPSLVLLTTVPILLIFLAVALIFKAKNWINIQVVMAICSLYVIVQYGCFWVVDVFGSHVQLVIDGLPFSYYGRSHFMPMVVIATAATFIFSSKMMNILNTVTVATYIFSVLIFKADAPYACYYDIFTVLIAYFMAYLIGSNFRRNQVYGFESKSKYKSLSMRDPLLENIYNKRGYEEAIRQYLLSKNPKVSCAFIVLDLNDFKGINDNYGHDMGDNILRCMSGTLVSLFRDSDIIGRFGGDEFIVLADGLDDEEAVEKKLRYISELIGQRAQEAGAIKVYSSLGAVICHNQKVDFERLFKLADESMYVAKEKVKRAVEKDGRNMDCFIIKHYTEPSEEQ